MSERDEQVALFDWAKLKRNQDYRYGYLVAAKERVHEVCLQGAYFGG